MFPVFDVSAAVADRPEALGSKEKLWLTPAPTLGLANDLHLFKIGRAGTGENWSEKVACEIAKALGLPCAEYHLATCKGIKGVLSPRFLPRGSPLILGNMLFSTADDDYDGSLRYKQVRYKLLSALGIIRSFNIERVHLNGETSITPTDAFIGYLVFDALIGNTDRHHDNWGIMVLRHDGRPQLHLAPSFDHASSLGRELTDDRRTVLLEPTDTRANVKTYAAKARSAFYGPGVSAKTMTSREVMETLLQAFPDFSHRWCAKVNSLGPSLFEAVLNNIPEEFISGLARQFALRLLAYNQAMIRELASG
jgi:HipA-like C-terminal domain